MNSNYKFHITNQAKTNYNLSYNDYYPYGMLVPTRNYSNPVYRYGFQGQEKDNEIKGIGNSINYKFRMYDPRIGRFFAVDPEAKKYSFQSPYAFATNNPVRLVDVDGLGVRPPDEWILNTDTGKLTKISNAGCNDFQFIYLVDKRNLPDIDNMLEIRGNLNNIYVGPIAQNYDGKWKYGVSNKDLWSDVPIEYQGHYMAWDLILRYKYAHKKTKFQINNIKEQEALFLDRREMSWNTSDDYNKVVSKYGSDASFLMCAEYRLLPMPIDETSTLEYTANSVIRRSILFFSPPKIKRLSYLHYL